MHEAVPLSPHGHMSEPKRPIPVLSRFAVAPRLHGRLELRGRPMFGLTQNWDGGVMSFHEFIYAF